MSIHDSTMNAASGEAVTADPRSHLTANPDDDCAFNLAPSRFDASALDAEQSGACVSSVAEDPRSASPSMSNEKGPIVVALSGGVDSATAAALLVEAGHRVVGMTMQLYDARGTAAGRCYGPTRRL